ncbi:DUF4034 domain-containing protein [Pseudomonas putida]|uniref:DUF4034 domain-containing protein n=1 Tax=Pseudomonas putida TaxID=303 RepID=A0A7W2L4L3_PSEPU|nr:MULTISPECIES: DUF4034 domain-containing protein [Pseudomonas]MBA6118290.1 DUF4034 domain-containing protein [Pseudomonas putida]MBI6943470.1 DUF4034 domain-containing protein [Pseudomonas putida]MBI6958645.1 DUF4034 domain-containing protein [Pseudomonas putida]MEC4876829.1 DUF4034 domain-containing protein [Pseudomonas sp. NC26]PZQ36097.1 MAG: hypothetical protein DI560_25740 [Pseudomonas putida]
MQTLTRTRQQIRERVQAHEFADLNRYFDALQAHWQQAAPGECPAYLEAVQGYMLVDWDAEGSKTLSQTLKAWIDACPKAYHPQVVMGFHCLSRACHIRGAVAANDVSEAHWLAAEQACEMATAHFLRAMERSTQPVAAAIGMLRISAHFREPGWLVELFHGQAARFRPSAHADVEVQEAAAPLLVKYGLAPLVALPQGLPSCLSARLPGTQESAPAYWLRHALAWLPGCFEAVEARAAYLTPRWGGSYEAIEALASSPVCQRWNEMQRNALRWLAVEDQLRLPEPDQSQQIAVWQETFQHWAQRQLRPKERATLLARRGALRRYSLHDYHGAMRDFTACVALYPDQGFVPTIGEPFYSVVCLVLVHGVRDGAQTLRVVIERLCNNHRQAAACALRAAGHQFGLWGFRQSSEQANAWLRTAVKRQCGREGRGFDVLDVPRLLWAANLHEVAHFLYVHCADLKLPDAAVTLYDLHLGRLENTPQLYLSAELAQHWLLRAVACGNPRAKYTLACQRMQGAQDLERDTLLAVRRLLLDALGHPQVGARARLQLGILLRQHGEPQERNEAVDYLLGLAEHSDVGIAARASAELGLAWMQGHGTRKQSRFAAIEWVNRAAALQPGEPVIEEIQAQVLNSHSRVKTLLTVCGATLFRGDLQASELPQKAIAPEQERQKVSA